VVLHRKVMSPGGWAFHDGITIPAGTHLSAASCISNVHESVFEDPTVFDGMRFARMYEREVAEKEAVGDAEGALGIKYQLTSPSLDNLFYGVGKHACPGRSVLSSNLRTPINIIWYAIGSS
jgi:cytochrome P450